MSALHKAMPDTTQASQNIRIFGFDNALGLGYQLPVQPPTLPLTTRIFSVITQKRALTMSTHGVFLAAYLKTAQALPSHGALLSAYQEAAQALPFVEAVYADDTAGLTIYTVYQGDPDEIDTDLYRAYQRMYQMFPEAVIDFRMVSSERTESLPPSAHLLFRRA